MELISLKLTNFEGIKSLEITADGKSVSIYGDNGTGKTTIADAQTWLLFDRDSAFTPNFMPKPRDTAGEERHNIDAEVEGVYRMEDGTQVTLRKVFSENWKKKRGSTEAVFSGHNVSYYIDDVPKKEKEYNEFIESIAPIQTLLLLSIPQYFPETLEIKHRRPLLMAMERNIHDFDVIDSCEELKPLKHLTLKPGASANWYDMDEFVQISKAAAKKANDGLDEIPGRIDEQNRNLSGITEERAAAVKAEIGRLNAKKISLQLEMNSSDSEMMQSLRADISGLNAKLEDKRAEHIRKCTEANADISAQIENLTRQHMEQIAIVSKVGSERQEKLQEIERLRASRAELLQQWNEVKESEWQGDTVCPTCGQSIPEEKVAAAKAEFNQRKSERLSALNEKGKTVCSKEIIAAKEAELGAVGSRLYIAEGDVQKTLSDIDKLKSQLTTAQPFEQTECYAEIMHDIQTTQSQLDALTECKMGKSAEKRREINDIEQQIGELNVEVARYEAECKARERIAELENQEKILSDAYAKARQGLDLAELFSRKKAELLTDKINAHFENVRFRLFKVQINEGIKDDCEVLALTGNGHIPYSTANNAARINAGLEIIRGFAKHFGVKMPVFVDNAESVTELDSKGLQVIRLVVSKDDKVLRIETEE